ncbi:uncharacterized protein BX663DRAFT_516355 [Cokeromyces recurvatus]|uniref:uncharacterized protein n=1 Tax=Cokeromyces recurvatus TaxID=90255 RepID=UPI0022208F8F|nr:uncharacterized protein BX663DRAFT_516355 [Cokeromyces recurvatus]KAI7900742.1 hypothetical protein BX663DRAFT_516355 [Cokeromyces recurvatus]
MSYSPMDLDSSLDDLIKKRKQNGKKDNPKQQKNKKQDPRPPIQTNKAKITKPKQRQTTSSSINSRLSTSKTMSTPRGPLFTAKNRLHQTPTKPVKADPSQIIITKTLPKSTSIIRNRLGPSSKEEQPRIKSVITTNSSRLGTTISRVREPLSPPRENRGMRIDAMAYEPRPSERMGEFTIRGRSNTAVARPGLSIKGESGPATVLITGLDPGANSEDVRISFEQFGNILHCEVLRDRAGRSFGEAEVEFSTKSAALDCIAMMDNQLADGKFLRIILREPKPPQSFAAKQIQSIIQPSYSSSGKMYSDQMSSRYDRYY